MTRFEWFDKGYAQMALELGFVTPSAFMSFIHYKRYCDVRPEVKNQTEAIYVLTEEFNCSFSTIYRSIKAFHISE